ncbi:MAG: DNA alkylation repair protein [Spirochaetaceae bacterium]|nr:MAG: DNA alkylation repair protein [Spirochaetaceae bacterium]
MPELDAQTDRPLFKDAFSESGAKTLERELRDVLPGPDPPGLASLAARLARGFTALELMDRSRLVTRELCELLPADPHAAFAVLTGLADRWLANCRVDGDDLSSFWVMAMIDCVPEIGLKRSDAPIELCLDTLKAMTRCFSAEFAIRPFLIAEPELVLATLAEWTTDPDPAVRRLVSEGTRPRLPWGIRLQAFVADPAPLFPLLTALVDDPDEVVRRSVANNVNDIAKDHPDLAVELLRRWSDEISRMPDFERTARLRLVRHAGRTLVKKGNAEMLALLGYTAATGIEIRGHETEPAVVPGGGTVRLTWTLENRSESEKELLLDYRIRFVKTNGTRNEKVFKGTETRIAAGETIEFSRSFSFRPITTRRYYAGEHAAELIVNGEARGEVTWVYEARAASAP